MVLRTVCNQVVVYDTVQIPRYQVTYAFGGEEFSITLYQRPRDSLDCEGPPLSVGGGGGGIAARVGAVGACPRHSPPRERRWGRSAVRRGGLPGRAVRARDIAMGCRRGCRNSAADDLLHRHLPARRWLRKT